MSGAGTLMPGPMKPFHTSSAAYRRVTFSRTSTDVVYGLILTAPLLPPKGTFTIAHLNVMSDASADFTLRPVNLGDAPRIAKLIGDWEVVRWLSGPPHPYALADAEDFLAELPAKQVGLTRHEAIDIDGQLAGLIGIDLRANEPNRGRWNLGFWLGRPYWQRGIMGRAAAQLTRNFFATSSET